MSIKNKKIAARIFEEMWNGRKPELAKEFFTADAVLHDPYVPTPKKGIEGHAAYLQAFMKAIPDLKFTVEEQVAEEETVVTRLLAGGTHEGELLGVPATHKKATVPVVVFHRFRDGKVADAWIIWDALGFMREVGALEALKAAHATV
jgi:steroid delta-isomerase-like uncharacterized protein